MAWARPKRCRGMAVISDIGVGHCHIIFFHIFPLVWLSICFFSLCRALVLVLVLFLLVLLLVHVHFVFGVIYAG